MVVCANDCMALGAWRALHESGDAVPRAVSVAGMGGFHGWSPPERPLTTVLKGYRMVGRRAGALLLHLLAGDGTPPRASLPATLRLGGPLVPAPA